MIAWRAVVLALCLLFASSALAQTTQGTPPLDQGQQGQGQQFQNPAEQGLPTTGPAPDVLAGRVTAVTPASQSRSTLEVTLADGQRISLTTRNEFKVGDPVEVNRITAPDGTVSYEIPESPEYLEGTVTKLLPLPDDATAQGRDLEVRLTTGETVRATDDNRKFAVGERIEVFKTLGPDDNTIYYATDHVRRVPLAILAFVFVAVAAIVGRGKGFRAVVSMLASLAVVILVIVPAIAAGWSPVLVTLAGATLILAVSVYFVHGFNITSTAALLATILAALIVIGLSYLFSGLTHLTGYGSEEAIFIQQMGAQVNVYGLMIAGTIVGALGALVDSTVAQAAVVRELANLNPQLQGRKLYQSGMAVGFDHIGSLINTLVLAYAGSSLPLFVLFSLGGMTFNRAINSEMIATEIVHALVGSIGLVLAVPLATFIAALFFVGSRFPGRDNVHTHARAQVPRSREQAIADALAMPSREGSRLMQNPRQLLDDGRAGNRDPGADDTP